MPLLNVAVVPAPDQVVVRLTGDADLSTVPLVAEALTEAAGLGPRQVIVDLAAARFWDSSGLRQLSAFTARLAAADRACRLVAASPNTRRLIQAAGLADALHLDGPVAAGTQGPAAGCALDGPPHRSVTPADRRHGAAPRQPVRCATEPMAALRDPVHR